MFIRKYLLRYKTTIKNIGNYFLASLIPMIVSMITSPIFAIYLAPEDYAVISYYNSFNSLLMPLVLFYFNQYYLREYFYLDKNGQEVLRAVMFKCFIFLSGILWIISLGGLYIYMHFFNSDSSIPFFPYAIISLLPICFSGIYRLQLIDYKVQKESKSFLYISLFYSISGTLLSLLFVVAFQWHATGKLLGVLIGSLFVFIWLLFKNKRLFSIPFDKGVFKQSFLFCCPLVLSAMLGFFSNGYDRVVLERHVDIALLGIYSIGVSFAGYLNVFSTAINDTFSPDLFESLANKDFKRMMRISLLQIGVMLIVVLVFVGFANVAVYLLTAGRYMDSTPIARIAAFSTITSMFYGIVSSIVYSYKKTQLFLFSKIIGSIGCVVLFDYLISNYGINGAVWGNVISHLIYTVILFIMLKISLFHHNRRVSK